MKIQVLGSDCPNCKKLYEKTKKIAKELEFDTEVEYSKDPAKLIEIGIMTSPALVVNDKVVLTGGGFEEDDIKDALISNLMQKKHEGGDCASCGCCG